MAYTDDEIAIANQALDMLHEAPITLFEDGTAEADWFIRNYNTTRDAELRKNRWRFSIKREILYPYDFVLEGITATLTGAWAPFRLNREWHGDLITLRRDSDDTTDDFGIGTDDGDDEILIDTSAISTFIGSGDGYFDTIFDQSGNANDISQSTNGKQPIYATDIGDNDVVTASFDGSNDVLSSAVAMTSLMSVSAGYMVICGLIDAATLDSATTTSNHLLMGEASKNTGLYVRKGGVLYGVNDDGAIDAPTEHARLLVPFIAELWHDSGTMYCRVNGRDESSATSGDTSSLAGILNIGDLTAGSQALDFKLIAAMTFSSVPSRAERNKMVLRLARYSAVPGFDTFGWAYRYALPADCLRPLPLRKDGKFEGKPIKHEIEQDYILCDIATKLPIRYISQFKDAGSFDPLFKTALAAALATKIAHWLTGKLSSVGLMVQAYNRALSDAEIADSLEGTDERPADDDIIDQRYDAEGVR